MVHFNEKNPYGIFYEDNFYVVWLSPAQPSEAIFYMSTDTKSWLQFFLKVRFHLEILAQKQNFSSHDVQ